MNVIPTEISDVLILEPTIFADDRGFFQETWSAQQFNELIGHEVNFVQENYSHSRHGVIRGLHFQRIQPQGKLIRVTHGRVFDVTVDIRPKSPTFGQHTCVELSRENHRQLWIPPGFAHGFLVLSETADLHYKATDYYHPASEGTLAWNDPTLQIDWPLHSVQGEIQLSEKDQRGISLDFLTNNLKC